MGKHHPICCDDRSFLLFSNQDTKIEQDAEYYEMTAYTYDYPRPSLTADMLALRWHRQQLELLLIKRENEPFSDTLALPGGFVDPRESPPEAAARECFEETQVSVEVEQLIEVGSFGRPKRDPRGWTVSIAFIALLPSDTEASALDDAREVIWIPWSDVLNGRHTLAFDHQDIIKRAHQCLQNESLTSTQLLKLLDHPFRTRHVRFLYRQLWGERVNPRAFKAWLRQVDLIEKTGRALFKAKSHLRLPW